MLAGGFGNYLGIKSALGIGIIPATLPESKIRYVGNAAALGAQLALVSEAERQRAETIARASSTCPWPPTRTSRTSSWSA